MQKVKQALEYEPTEEDLQLLALEVAKWRTEPAVEWAIGDPSDRKQFQDTVIELAALSYKQSHDAANPPKGTGEGE
jgi:hypothetical protein